MCDYIVTGDSWKELKESGKLDFGSVPMLELEDGTRLTQTNAVLHYVGKMYGLIPEDPLAAYRGYKAATYVLDDYQWKH